MLTRRQREILNFINNFIDKNGYAPSLEEIKKHFKLRSVATVHEHVELLKTKGYIRKEEKQPRGFLPTEKDLTIDVPLIGTIAAGEPIEAIEQPEETIPVTRDQLGKNGNYYALRVRGNSMIDEGIFDGDIVVIKHQKYADNGQTVVAIIDNNETTLKKFFKERDKIRLQPANPTLFPIYREEVEIRGIVVKIIRNLNYPTRAYDGDSKFKRRIDYSWDYKGEKTKAYTHCFHAYPAMFIPQVARRLLETYSNKGDTVCDIFCGSGTALVESRLLGRNAYGIDLNPLAIFLAKIKTKELNPSVLTKNYFHLLEYISKIKDADVKRPNFMNIDFWFKENVILNLAKIKKSIKEIKEDVSVEP